MNVAAKLLPEAIAEHSPSFKGGGGGFSVLIIGNDGSGFEAQTAPGGEEGLLSERLSRNEMLARILALYGIVAFD